MDIETHICFAHKACQRSDRRCLTLATSSLLCSKWICVYSICLACSCHRASASPGSLLSFDIALQISTMSSSFSCLCLRPVFFFFSLSSTVLFRYVTKVDRSDTYVPVANLGFFLGSRCTLCVTPMTLCFQISSLPTAWIITAPFGKATSPGASLGAVCVCVCVVFFFKSHRSERRYPEAVNA